jgi:hypothetical protein
MKRNSKLAPVLFVLPVVVALGPIPVLAQGTPPADVGPQGPLGTPTVLVDLALENGDELGLTADQAGRLEAFRAASMERTTEAREVIAAWREEIVAERDALADSADMGPRDRRRARSSVARPTAEVREALRAVRVEGEAAMDELRATLTVDQMSELRGLARDEFPGLARRGPDGGRGMAPGFGPRAGPASRPGFGPGFGPRFGPGFGPDFGPDERFRRRFGR